VTVEQVGTLAFQVAMGIGLAACAGLRAFLPLLVVSVAGKLGWVPLSDRFEWLASWPAIVVFGVAVVTELLSDKIPLIDNLLDTVQVWVKPIAGALLAVAVLTELEPLPATALGIMAGASSAGIVHIVKAKVRLLSSALTTGLGNPILSVIEDAVALVGSILSVVVPFLIVALLALAIVGVVFAVRRFTPRTTRS
jgi:uncharacterized membrane protein